MKKKIVDEINIFLIKHWDPIGIQNDLGASDEYYSYVEKIVSIISSSKTYLRLFNYLREIENYQMGIEGDKDKTEAVAKALFEIFEPRIKD